MKLGQVKLTNTLSQGVYVDGREIGFAVTVILILDKLKSKYSIVSFWSSKPKSTKKTIEIYRLSEIDCDGDPWFDDLFHLCKKELNKYVDISKLKYLRLEKTITGDK